MELNNQQLNNYVDRIKFGRKDKEKYQGQIDNLKATVEKYITEHTECNVIKTIQAGSWKKSTILYPRDGVELDIDLVFFIDQGTSTEKDIRDLNEKIKKFLFKVYPNKTQGDFWDSPKSAGVVFRGTGLNFDIVPVVPIEPVPYVWQPEKGSRGYYYTSIDGQLSFNSNRKIDNANYTSIVRILKKWKNIHDLKISSFSIEIIVGWLDKAKAIETNIEKSLIRFFDILGRHEFPYMAFQTEVTTEYDKNSKGAVYIADPTNRGNNTAEYVTLADWKLIQEKARDAFEKLVYARELEGKQKTLDLWKEVLSSTFNIDPIT